MRSRGKHKGAAYAAPLLGLLMAFWDVCAVAAAVDVNPVRLEIRRAGESTELHIRNEDSIPVSMDVTAMRWSQSVDGEDRLAETDEILAVPPIFTIEPGGQQIVRVAFLGAIDTDREQTFRLLVTELAPPAGPQGAAVSMRLQISLPIFVAAPGQTIGPKIQLAATRQSESGTFVTLHNAGRSHVKLKSVSVVGSEGTLPAEGQPAVGLARYLLPGTTMEFFIPGDAGALQRVLVVPDQGKGWEHAVATPE